MHSPESVREQHTVPVPLKVRTLPLLLFCGEVLHGPDPNGRKEVLPRFDRHRTIFLLNGHVIVVVVDFTTRLLCFCNAPTASMRSLGVIARIPWLLSRRCGKMNRDETRTAGSSTATLGRVD